LLILGTKLTVYCNCDA